MVEKAENISPMNQFNLTNVMSYQSNFGETIEPSSKVKIKDFLSKSGI